MPAEGPGLKRRYGCLHQISKGPVNTSQADDNVDGKPKETSFRYADGQDTAGINPTCVFYKFELDPQNMTYEVGMSNTGAMLEAR